MKKISSDEQKKILVGILSYIDKICRENHIKYTLVGGSLIGAIRHKGFIPWDDDIDIGLLPSEYNKLIEYLRNNMNTNFKLLEPGKEKSYYYPFAKVVDLRTTGYEKDRKKINDYGVYIDIFKYNNIPENENEIEKYYKKLQSFKRKLGRTIQINSDNFIKRQLYKILNKFDSEKISKKYIKFSEKYNKEQTTKVMLNWPPYGAKKETLLRSSFDEYKDAKFENMTAMIITDYDRVLTNIFGDYMTPPPIEKQISNHSMIMYWKEKDEK